MLAKGFLGQLSNWVSEQTAKDEAVMEKATERFGLRKLLENVSEPGKTLGLFSEWLVFDYKQSIFDNRTGLEFFTEQNPLHLPKEEIEAYTDMRSFEVGQFEVRKVETGKGVVLLSFASDKEYFVHDVNASLSLRENQTVWTRIAPIGGLYHCVGSLFFIMPMRVKAGMREVIAGWKKNSYDAKAVAFFATDSPNREPTETPSYEESLQNFKNALGKCGMTGFFSIPTFTKWVSDEKKYGRDFTPHALDSLIPDSVAFKDVAELVRVSAEFTNNIPRKSLKGKTPNEAIRERKAGEVGDWETDIFSKEKYFKVLEKANEYMAQGEFEKSYNAFEQVIKDLLKDKLPFFHTFRVYANAAVCCFHKGDEMLGEALLDASLRINPLYDFGMHQKERYVHDPTHEEEFTSFPKKDQKMIQGLRDDMRKTGKRMYQHRVFSKYEKLLQELGVSLAYKAKTVPDLYSFNKDGNPMKKAKIGRNESCLCGSGKKFKKCCGR
ncbi:MAG: hypothetical protein COV91_00615 [Candidatus Taylorbacteria bacterium CG11_big_fil_rev_8_21_14_0_20_46_11]|uniref:Uncharacterized protein n=1 Tax=Candidatus Taylorbacteria bacterium CG11_big_fil_rev_8_21_14_0_20_46_11 TaxID=1975025 RepID=A0A2H0KCZ1_9BACT|nr:MAG: hypothetical protein COV91_00615 [Candidatus Taylorbacteria bacterium CG11_big_fil_rev_8_21_14_0_20_46_11]